MVEGNGVMVRPRIIEGDQSSKMTFSVSNETAERLNVLAQKENRSVSSLVRRAVTDYLKGMDE